MFESCLRNYPARLDVWSQYLDQVSSLHVQSLLFVEIHCILHSFLSFAHVPTDYLKYQIVGSGGTKCCALAHVKHNLWHGYFACKELKPKWDRVFTYVLATYAYSYVILNCVDVTHWAAPLQPIECS